MKTDLHLLFPGTCREAFAFYEKTFGSKLLLSITFGEAPQDMKMGDQMKDLIMHTALPVGSITLMGADTTPNRQQAMGGFMVSLAPDDEAEARRLFDALSGGAVQMPLAATFWSPLFGMCTDQFGVAWTIGLEGPSPS